MKKIFIILTALAFLSTAFISCAKKDETQPATPAASTGDAAAKHKEGYNAVVAIFNSGNLAELGKYIDSNYVDHTPDFRTSRWKCLILSLKATSWQGMSVSPVHALTT
jgi:hypothetical protein